MTNEERDLITQFIQRVGGTPVRAPGSVPSTLPAPAHPPIDREADALIADLLQRHPEARYRLTQMAFVQEHALAEAQNTINRLQWELDQARTQQMPVQHMPPQQAPASPWGAAAQAQPQPSRGLFGGMFGGRPSAPPPPPPGYGQSRNMPPPPVHAPGYKPGMFQQQPQAGGGGGFLASALTTAAGVAGGMVVGNMLMNAFSGGGAAQAASAASSPWTNPTGAAEPAPQDTGWTQPTSDPGADQGGWQDAGYQDEADTGWTEGGSDEEF